MDCNRKEIQLYLIVFIQTLYVYLGSLLCIRNDGNAILCCFYDFHHFVIWRGWRGVSGPLSLYGCLLELAESFALSADVSSSFWKWNGYVITSKHQILRRGGGGGRRGWREMCAWNFYRRRMPVYFKCFVFFSCHPSRTFPILHVFSTVTVRATRALAKKHGGGFLFLASSWGGGALNSYLRPPLP